MLGDKVIKREKYVAEIDRALKKSNLVLISGGRKWGKTTVIKQHLDSTKNLGVYCNLEHSTLTPENFVIEIIGTALFFYEKAPRKTFQKYQTLPFLLTKKEVMGSEAFNCLTVVQNELEKIKPNQQQLLEQLSLFIQRFSKHINKTIQLCLDNAEHLLDLNNFSSVSDIRVLFDKQINFLLSSSTPQSIIELFETIPHIALNSFSQEETEELINLHNKKLSKKEQEQIYSISKGHPFVISLLLQQWQEKILHNFISQLLTENSSLFLHCQQTVDYYHSKARGQSLTKAVMNVVCQEELRLSEVARKIYRSAPVTKSLIERLMAVSVIQKSDKRFSFSDPLLGLWLKLVNQGYDRDDIEEVIKNT